MKIPANILEHLSRAEVDGALVRLVGTLERKDYEKTNAVLEAIGGKWNRKTKAHVFPEDAQPLLDVVIDNGEVTTVREKTKALGFFPTPAKLADLCVLMANVCDGDRVLEPSAGDGAICKALIKEGASVVVACEFDHTRRNLLIDKVLRKNDEVVIHADFLDLPVGEIEPFDAVVMNPPFLKVGQGDHLDHVRHAFAHLKPGGFLVAIMPSSITFRADKRHVGFRAWLETAGRAPAQITKNAEGAFAESGTHVSTVIVKIQK